MHANEVWALSGWRQDISCKVIGTISAGLANLCFAVRDQSLTGQSCHDIKPLSAKAFVASPEGLDTEPLFGAHSERAMLSVDRNIVRNVAGGLVGRGNSDVISQVNVPSGWDAR